LTPEERREDIQFLAQWAKDYSPFVELNEKYKDCPSYESLKPKYVKLAEQAQNNEEFLRVVYGYFNLIGASGHSYLLSELQLWGYMIGMKNPIEISWGQFFEAIYWAKLLYKTSFVHPPFRIVCKEGEYFTGEAWRYKGIKVPQGSKIVKVNGMTCSSYLDSTKKNTWLRYVAGDVDSITKYLLIINEGKNFRGWQVDFLLPDNTTRRAFVPTKKGHPDPKMSLAYWLKRNCICLELNDDVGYIRINTFFGFGDFIKRDRKIIKTFFEHSQGKYSKLIIDIRNNPGGADYYFYDNLIRPFLDRAVTYKQIAGIKRKFIIDTKASYLEYLRGSSSIWAWEVNIKETEPPNGFDSKEWIFYKITRKVEPSNRYNFNGDIYILINNHTCSAADNYADAIKRTGLVTLVGQNTGGSAGAYFIPVLVRLPASGMIFILEADLDITPNGNFNELFGVEPDVKLPPCDLPESITREELLKDEWIQKIINEL
jgi:hypothetical protein